VLTPQVNQIEVTNSRTVLIYFNEPLDTNVIVPITSFTVNYGQVVISTMLYSSDTIVALGLQENLSTHDEVFVSYEPPPKLDNCLRGPTPAGATATTLKRASVRSFHRVPATNKLAYDEQLNGWVAQSNLGHTIGGYGFPYQNRNPDPRNATPDDFVMAYGLKEAIQLTNIDDAAATSVNQAKLWMAIQDANSLIDSHIEQAGKAGQVIISSNRKRTALIVARYYLDTVRRRDDVYRDYENCLKLLDAQMRMTNIRAGNQDSAVDTPQGIMRSWRIPQRYNGVTGKGFSGWATDAAGDLAPDFRIGWGAIGQNNDVPNGYTTGWGDPYAMERLDGNTGVTMQPTDAGGWRMSSSDQTFGGPGAWYGGTPNNLNGPVFYDGMPRCPGQNDH
jgi:phage gp36-like protein